MTTADRRLDAVTTGLTARERAILTIGIWNRSEEPEDRLIKYMPPEQKEEFERLVKAVENANDEFWSDCSLWCEWIQQADIELAWLESISAVFARQAKLVAALKVQGVAVREEAKASRLASSRQALILPPMPPPGRGFHRDIPRLLGVALHEEDPPPENWEGAIRSLSDSVREAVEVRWQDLAATEIALGELAEAFGADCCNPKLREVLDAVRRKLLDHYASVLLFTGPFRLPEPAERFLEIARSRVDWDAFKSKEDQATSHQQSQRAWLSQEQRAALEEIEARWKDEARSLKPSPARDIIRGVPALPAGPRRRKPRRRS